MFNHEPNQKNPDPDFEVRFIKFVRRTALFMWTSSFLCSLGFIWQFGGNINAAIAVMSLLGIIIAYRIREKT